MILVDCNGYLCEDNKVKVSVQEGGQTEARFNLLVARKISPINHSVRVREPNMTAKERALFLLGNEVRDDEILNPMVGLSREDIALSLRISSDPLYQGFTVMIAPGNYGPDCLLQDTLRRWLGLFPDLRDLTDEEDIIAKRKAPLLVHRLPTELRPARAQIELCSMSAIDAEYWLRPIQMKLFGQHISRAINEYDDIYNQCIEQGVFSFTDIEANDPEMPAGDDSEDDSKGAEIPTPRKKKKKKVTLVEGKELGG